MKIVHIATTTSGGAGIAARRLSSSLNSKGHDSVLITGSSTATNQKQNEKIVNKKILQRVLSKALTYIQSRMIQSDDYLMTPLSIQSLDLNLIKNENPDIVHIHSSYNFLNSKAIRDLCDMGKPVFLTLHDERFFTGGCHQSFTCMNYQESCTNCPYVNKAFAHLPKNELLSMESAYGNRPNLTVIAPSEWIYNKANESAVLRKSRIVKIFNAIDEIYVQDFSDRLKARSHYIITFVAQDLYNKYKGFETLLECMATYYSEFNEQKIRFQVVGAGKKIDNNFLLLRQFSKIDEVEMKKIYSDTDLLIVPSSADNSPNIIFEALACGVPFVGSDRGGIPELAKIFGMETFAFGNSKSMYNAILKQKSKVHDSKNLREKALLLCHPEQIANKHLNLYKSKLISAD